MLRLPLRPGTNSNRLEIRNHVNNKKKYKESRFKAEKIGSTLDSPAQTWTTTKKFMGWKETGGPPNQLNIGGNLVTKAASIAMEMNHFFMNKVKAIRKGIRYLPNSFSRCKQVMEGKDCKLYLQHVSIAKVNKLLRSLKTTKSTGIDGLDNFSIKVAADIIDKPLHHIISLSIMQNRFPRTWKFSKVVPLHKKQCRLEMKNYRPVSILSPLSKILEKVVYEQLYEYFSKNRILHPNLHGYRQCRSTQTALLTMYDRWVKAAVAGQVSGAVLLDLSAAFDLVDQELLVSKLGIYGLDRDLLCWIQSYLSNRYQAVWVDHALSDFVPVEVGVPQGSNLGPLFFLVFFNDLLYDLESDVDSYADDTTITTTAKTVSEIGIKLTSDCARVSNWMRSNRLKLNPDKTHIMTLGTSERLRTLREPVRVTMDHFLLEEDPEQSEILLGCHIQTNLKWHNHIKNLLRKLKNRVVGLMKIRSILPFHHRKIISEGLFNSVLVYCLPLFGGMGVGDMKELQVMQNKVARMVTKMPPRSERSTMYKKLGWLTINQLVFYHTSIQVFKIRSNNEPEHLASILRLDSRNRRILIPNLNLKIAQDSFTVRGAASWNLLPLSIREQTKIGIFKKLMKSWVLDNISMFLE